MTDLQNPAQKTARQEKPRRRGLGTLFHHMRLNTRLILIIALITLPIFLISSAAVGRRVQLAMQVQSDQQLQQTNQAVVTSLRIWLNFNEQMIRYLADSPQIRSLVAPLQEPFMVGVGEAFPQLYLIHTMDLNGLDIARNDRKELTDYGDRAYFQSAVTGSPLAIESVIGRTTQRPAVIYAAPVYNVEGQIVQIVSFATEITDVASGVNVGRVGQTGYSYIIDPNGFLIAHPDTSLTTELRDFSQYPPVKYMREGGRGLFTFTDENGEEWYSYVDQLDSGHGVIIQQTAQEVLSAQNVARRANLTGISIALALTLLVAWLLIRRTLKPVEDLTLAAEKMAGGDLNQRVNINRGDEIGSLANAFNLMSAQLKGIFGSLESQVQERTRMLQISSEVSRNLSTILDPQQLVREVVEQLKNAFGYYHAHIYLVDKTNQTLVMAGGTGEAGQIMLERGHKLAHGQGLVGRTAESKQPVLVPDVSTAEGWLPNPLLPDTRAEAAVPILLGNDVMGVLDVQHNIPDGLTQQDVDLLQTIANQVAIALQNAQAYTEAQQRAERESIAANIAAQVQRAGTVDEVLQVALNGLNQALKSDRAAVELRSPASRKNGNS
ncbi:MAG: GAF domain-containing protein [Anaerolineaceae bacterium]|nr:GAF domain-containing protein [Anaerolineaceae bacterium]